MKKLLLPFLLLAYGTIYAQYDVAAYIWPAFHDDPRWHEINVFPECKGEWESIYKAEPKFEGHRQPRIPLWGYLDEADVKVQEKIINCATKYGVNTFIFDWYWYENRAFLEAPLNAFLKARNTEKMKFYLMWANHTATDYWDRTVANKGKTIWRGDIDHKTFEGFTDHIIQDYFLKPNYYRIDGKPVFAIYELGTFIKGMGGLSEAKAALEAFTEKCVAAGLPGVHLQAIMWKLPAPADRTLAELGFESVTSYQWCHYASANQEYTAWGEAAQKKIDELQAEIKIPYFAHVSIDWDNNPRFPQSSIQGSVKDPTPEKFKVFLQRAKAYVDSHPNQAPLVSINAWNEWSEGSYLEPDTEYKYRYLEAVRDVFLKQH